MVSNIDNFVQGINFLSGRGYLLYVRSSYYDEEYSIRIQLKNTNKISEYEYAYLSSLGFSAANYAEDILQWR